MITLSGALDGYAPRVRLIDLPVNQDACKGVVLRSLHGERALMRLRAMKPGGSALVVALALLMFVIAGTALAYWKANGSGTGTGAVGSLDAPTAVSATTGSGTAHVSWTASTTTGGRPAPTGYYVRRWSGAMPDHGRRQLRHTCGAGQPDELRRRGDRRRHLHVHGRRRLPQLDGRERALDP